MIRTGIDSYCYHRFFGVVYPDQAPAESSMSVNDFLQEANRLGAKAVSLCGSFLERLEEPYMQELAGQIQGFGFEAIYSWDGPGDIESLTGGPNANAFSDLKRHVALAKMMGASIVRITSAGFRSRHRGNHADIIQALVSGFKETAQVAQNYDIQLAFENQMVLNPEQLLQLVEQVDSDYFGLSLDTGNCVRQLDDPLDVMNLLGLRAKLVMMKPVWPDMKEAGIGDWFFFAGVPAGQGLTNDQAIFDLLERADYKGCVIYTMDHPQSSWYGREKEAALISMHKMQQMARYASR